MIHYRIFLKTILYLVAVCLLAEDSPAQEIVIGSINKDPMEEVKVFSPISTFLGEELKGSGITAGKTVIAKNINDMAELIREGQVDLYIDSPYPALEVSRLSGSVPFLRRWKKGVGEYRSVIFVSEDSEIATLTDLKGKLLALEEPWSSSAYFLPKLSLVSQGFKLSEKKDFRSTVQDDEVGYVFSGADKNTMFWVLRHRVAAGAMEESKIEKLEAKEQAKVKILLTTEAIPRHIVVYRSDLDPALVQQITSILTSMDTTEKGRAVLEEFENTTKFDAIPANSLDILKNGMRMMSLD